MIHLDIKITSTTEEPKEKFCEFLRTIANEIEKQEEKSPVVTKQYNIRKERKS